MQNRSFHRESSTSACPEPLLSPVTGLKGREHPNARRSSGAYSRRNGCLCLNNSLGYSVQISRRQKAELSLSPQQVNSLGDWARASIQTSLFCLKCRFEECARLGGRAEGQNLRGDCPTHQGSAQGCSLPKPMRT